jgi:hypothetical protein
MARALDAYLMKAGAEVGAKDLAEHMAATFPGDQERQATWLRAAKARPVRAKTMPPPMPLPEVKLGADKRDTPQPVKPPPKDAANAEPPKEGSKAEPQKEQPSRKSARPTAKSPKKSAARDAKREAAAAAHRVEADADRRFWMYAAAAFVAILILIAATMR